MVLLLLAISISALSFNLNPLPTQQSTYAQSAKTSDLKQEVKQNISPDKNQESLSISGLQSPPTGEDGGISASFEIQHFDLSGELSYIYSSQVFGNLKKDIFGDIFGDPPNRYYPTGTWQVSCYQASKKVNGEWQVNFDYQGPASTYPLVEGIANMAADQYIEVKQGTFSSNGFLFADPNAQGGRACGVTSPLSSTSTGYGFGSFVTQTNGDMTSAGKTETHEWDIVIHNSTSNQPPIADAGPDQIVNVAESVTLDGTASRDPNGDPNGNDLTYKWTQTDGTKILSFDAVSSQSKPQFEFPDTGNTDEVLKFSLIVKDRDGLESQADEVRVIRNHLPDPVVMILPSDTVDEGTVVTLDGSQSTDPDLGDKVISYTWQQIEGPDLNLSIVQAPSLQFSAPTVNQDTVFTFGLGVSDTNGGIASTSTSITVKDSSSNTPPIAIAKSNTAVTGTTANLDGSESYDPDSNDKITNYQWTQTDISGVKVGIITPDTSMPGATFKAPDKVPVKVISNQAPPEIVPLEFALKVTDNNGATSTDTDKSKVNVTITCSPEDEKTVNKVKGQLNQAIGIAKSQGWTHFIFGMNKWLSGDNTQLQLDGEWLKKVSLFTDAAFENKFRLHHNPIGNGPNKGDSLINTVIKVYKDGVTRTFSDQWDSAKSAPLPLPSRNAETNDFAVTVGSFQLTTKGTFVVSKEPDGKITIKANAVDTITQKVNGVKQPYDVFDFNSGEKFPPAPLSWIPGMPTIYFDELNLLKKCKGANDYHQSGQVEEELEVTEDIQKLIQGMISPTNLLSLWKFK